MKNIINKIIQYFKNFFLSFYKSTTIEEDQKEDVILTDDVTDGITYKICLRGYIKDYSIINISVKINNEESVTLTEPLGYKEEYILESNYSDDFIILNISNSIQCIDGEIINNLGFQKVIDKGTTIINITDKLLGLIPIAFSAEVEDFIPVKTATIQI